MHHKEDSSGDESRAPSSDPDDNMHYSPASAMSVQQLAVAVSANLEEAASGVRRAIGVHVDELAGEAPRVEFAPAALVIADRHRDQPRQRQS